MTTEQRIDRIEDEFETVKQLLMSSARLAESADRRIDRLSEKLDRLTDRVDLLTASQEQLVSQAAIDRAEFRSTVTQMLEMLTQRFNGNGTNQE